MSTVDDMFLWSKAIQNSTLISEKSKRMDFANHTLENGKCTNYGYGWFINKLAGENSLEHTGGISGFTTSGIFVSGKNIYVVVLTNRNDGRGPTTLNLKAISVVLGKPIGEETPIKLSEKQLKEWSGVYQFDDVIC